MGGSMAASLRPSQSRWPTVQPGVTLGSLPSLCRQQAELRQPDMRDNHWQASLADTTSTPVPPPSPASPRHHHMHQHQRWSRGLGASTGSGTVKRQHERDESHGSAAAVCRTGRTA